MAPLEIRWLGRRRLLWARSGSRSGSDTVVTNARGRAYDWGVRLAAVMELFVICYALFIGRG